MALFASATAPSASLFAQAGPGRDLVLKSSEPGRFALVIGNDRYPRAPLRQATNDATDVAKVLEEIGFRVQVETDTTLRDFDRAVTGLVSKVHAGDVGLFFYAGHGFQLAGENYLVPVDFETTDEADARYRAYSASRIQERLEATGARLSILILDACRNNPFLNTRSEGGGLAPMNAGRGTFLALATGPGKLSFESPAGRNSLFTGNLLLALREPGLALDEVFNRVRERVYEESRQKQLPWTSSSVIGEFRFRQPPPQPQKIAVPQPPTVDPPKTLVNEGVTADSGKLLSGGVSAPRIIFKTDPKPLKGKKAPKDGFVELSFVIDLDGKATSIEVLRATDPGHQAAAIEAVKTWQFDPARKEGKPVPFPSKAQFTFNLLAPTLRDKLAPKGMPRIGDKGLRAPVPVTRVLPDFPPEGRKLKEVFWCALYAEIDEAGIPQEVKLLGKISGNEDESKVFLTVVPRAIEAFKQWRFSPAERAGQAVRVATSVQFNYLQRVGLSTPAAPNLGADFVAEVR